MSELKQEEILLKVEKLLPRSKGRFSPEDLAAETGFSLPDVNDAIRRLLEIYRAKVSMNPENGKLLFQFNYPLEKIGKKSFGEIMQLVLNWLWKAFQVVYKAATGIILIFYTVLFVVIILAAMLASGSNDRDRKGPDLSIFAGLFRAIFEGLYFISLSNRVQEMTDPSGLRYRQYAKPENKGKGFVQSVFHFVFGPEVPKKDLNEDRKEAIAFIRKVSNGKLTAADIVLLSGVTYDKAEELLAEYAAKFGGELEIDENGIVIADFTNLLHSQSQELDGGKIVYYYDEVEPPVELTGNTKGKNIGILAMNTFNLVVSIIMINSLNSPMIEYNYGIEVPIIAIIGLGWFPLLFSISFYLLPLVRIPFVLAAKKRRENNIIRKKLFYALVQVRNNITFDKLSSLINLPGELTERAKNSLSKLIAELKGEVQIGESGNPLYNVDYFISTLHR